MSSAPASARGQKSGQTIALFGLGYVGSVSACCLARAGHRVLGVEVVREKIDAINLGEVTFMEPGLEELAHTMVDAGRLQATHDAHRAVQESDISMVCVGTPSQASGAPDYSRLIQVCESIGRALRDKTEVHDIVLRSTVLPTTAERCAEVVAESSGKQEGRDFRVLVNPEFLREGTALHDYSCPPFTVIGARSDAEAARLRDLYIELPAPLFVVPRREAELVKYSCNLFHAVKVVFGNEIGRLSKAADIDSHRIMQIFCEDQKLNLSRYYLRPGYAYGGSCLPKDLRAILHFAREEGIDVPMLNSLETSNRGQIELGYQLIAHQKCRRVGMIGLSFKATTDDVRESPLVLLAAMLVKNSFDLRIFTPNVVVDELLGENKLFMQRHLPAAAELVTADLEAVLPWAECLVIGNHLPQAREVFERATSDQVIIDLARPVSDFSTKARYHGLGWSIKDRG